MNAVGSLPGQFEGGTVSFAGALPHVAHRPLSMMCWDRDTAQVCLIAVCRVSSKPSLLDQRVDPCRVL